MKTTIDLPDPLFRRAKAKAAETGRSLKRFITEAVEVRLQASDTEFKRPWMQVIQQLPRIPSQTREEIDRTIASADEQDVRIQKAVQP